MLPSMYANFATNYAPTMYVTLLQLPHRVFFQQNFLSLKMTQLQDFKNEFFSYHADCHMIISPVSIAV